MQQELLDGLQDPAQHDMIADKLAEMSAPPSPEGMAVLAQGAQGGRGNSFGAMLAQGSPDQQIPTGPRPAPPPAPGVQWWKQPSDPRPAPAQAPAQAPAPGPAAPPSRGFNPNQDRAWRDDTINLTDEEFVAKWGTPKPGGL